MTGFRSTLVVRDNDGLPYTLVHQLVYESALLCRVIVIPVDFSTDLASIPQALWSILPKSGRYDRAAVVHDFLYQRGGCLRSEADGVLKEAMESLHVPTWQCLSIYLAVRFGGAAVWDRYRAAERLTV